MKSLNITKMKKSMLKSNTKKIFREKIILKVIAKTRIFQIIKTSLDKMKKIMKLKKKMSINKMIKMKSLTKSKKNKKKKNKMQLKIPTVMQTKL